MLRGPQGVGKTKVGEIFGSLFLPHWKLVANPRYIVGNFNAHMASLLLLQADEGFWAGDKKAEAILKDLVTGKRRPIEYKGIDPIFVDNFVRLFVTSNEMWVVPAGFDERRFCINDVGVACKKTRLLRRNGRGDEQRRPRSAAVALARL